VLKALRRIASASFGAAAATTAVNTAADAATLAARATQGSDASAATSSHAGTKRTAAEGAENRVAKKARVDKESEFCKPGLSYAFASAGQTSSADIVSGPGGASAVAYAGKMGIDRGTVRTGDILRALAREVTASSSSSAGPATVLLPGSGASVPLATGKSLSALLQSSTVLAGGFEGAMPAPRAVAPKHKAVAAADKTSLGKNWFGMQRQELTEETRRDLLVLRNRQYADPKRHYKGKHDAIQGTKNLPKFFHMGTVVGSPQDRASQRIPNKQRKSSFVDALLEDSAFQRYAKKSIAEVVRSAPSHGKQKHLAKKFGLLPEWKKEMLSQKRGGGSSGGRNDRKSQRR
jgi:hypothetical protein